jgi:hypothetical protein
MTEEADVCAICLDEMTTETTALECGHKFHVGCIIKALRKSNECPYCRDTAGNAVKKTNTGGGGILAEFFNIDFEDIGSWGDESSFGTVEQGDYDEFAKMVRKIRRENAKIGEKFKEYSKELKDINKLVHSQQREYLKEKSKAIRDFSKTFKKENPIYLERQQKQREYSKRISALRQQIRIHITKQVGEDAQVNEFINHYFDKYQPNSSWLID